MGHKKSSCPNPAQDGFDGDGGFGSNEAAAADFAGTTGGEADNGWGTVGGEGFGVGAGGQSNAW